MAGSQRHVEPGPLRSRRPRARRAPPTRRLSIALSGLTLVLMLVAGRLFQLQVLDWPAYRTLAAAQRQQQISVPAVRGTITSSDGTVLALTVQSDTVYADPALVPRAQRPVVAAKVALPLGLTAAAVLDLIDHPSSPQYVVLARGVSGSVAARLTALNLPGIAETPGYTRVYPNGSLAANLIGFTDLRGSDLTGEAGLEEQYNTLLAGRDGHQIVETGGLGQIVPLSETAASPAVPARGLRLTINSSVQYYAQQQCRLRVKQTRARDCSAVVMTPKGRVLAMAQWPTFNPATPASVAATTDIPVADVFAPGSTLKVVTVAAALERGNQTPMSAYTVPDTLTWHGYHFHDADPHPVQRLTLAGILAYSSNDGMVQVAQHISPQTQYNYLRAFGLGSLSGLGLPGESAGLLPRPGSKQYWGDTRYELSFGQGIAVTAIQMASVYATIANGGVRVQPTIVAGTTSGSGAFTPARKAPARRVIKASTAAELMRMLEQVPAIDASVGEPWGLIAGYAVAAKTGTAQITMRGSHCLCQFGSSFIGIAPAGHPRLIVAVNIQDPTAHGYYGDQVAGPVFYHLMKFALQTMKIPPGGPAPKSIRLMAR